MKIPFNELIYNISYENDYYACYNGIADETLSNLMLCILYHNKAISRASFLARMNGDKTRTIQTYKSKVLHDKWFENMGLTGILIQEASSCAQRDLTFEQYFEYLNLGLNRGRNFCVEVIALGVFKAMLDNDYSSRAFFAFINQSEVINTKLLTYEDADYSHADLEFGYCCEDHDGCIEDYKRNRYEYHYKPRREDIVNELREAFLPMKTHLKNPKDKLLAWVA